MIQAESSDEDLWARDVEAWGLHKSAFHRLIFALARRRTRTIVLAGDVHYSFAARMNLQAPRPFDAPGAIPARLDAVIGQLNCSSLRNEGDERILLVLRGGSLRLHDGGYVQPYFGNMGRPVRRNGWNSSSDLRWRLSLTRSVPAPERPSWDPNPAVWDPLWHPGTIRPTTSPDWSYHITYLHGRKPPSTTPAVPRLEEVPADKEAAAAASKALHRRYSRDVRNDAGRDVVGVNNVAELRFGLDPVGVVRFAEQRTWWRFEANATPTPLTTFTIQLTPDTP
jgi:hypothetical protein